ncbi:type II secretion system minor pseudopilin GspK [Pelomonas sp. APW6]|uniref:Type II secretion system protein K n=1 Tax=Roseateles subflavus TaxID=3053353 RepID=A0ABT7LKE2_9BURK|nr:type II secretion system minor pseudopilin GspK [Pelomonas sp. APW6]MDL5032650.1 type II secretion system minor pseudopilin GspK [Pelomonas sp. APW6]
MSRRALRHRGAALLTALLLVTLVTSLAAAMIWRQYRAVQIESADRARAQSAWILQGALDWARLILREDARANQREPVDHLGEVWAVPLAEARLSTFLAAGPEGKPGTGDEDAGGPEAFLSGQLSDAQALYNLRNLTVGDQLPLAELRTLQRLCDSAGVPSNTAQTLAKQLRAAAGLVEDKRQAPLMPQTVDELVWLGLTPDVVKRLKPFVTLLPQRTAVNVNTAPREVIAALFEGMDLGSAERIVRDRVNQPLKSQDDIKRYLPQGVAPDDSRAAVASAYFFITGTLRLDERVLQERSLVWRNGLEMRVVARERVNLMLQAP